MVTVTGRGDNPMYIYIYTPWNLHSTCQEAIPQGNDRLPSINLHMLCWFEGGYVYVYIYVPCFIDFYQAILCHQGFCFWIPMDSEEIGSEAWIGRWKWTWKNQEVVILVSPLYWWPYLHFFGVDIMWHKYHSPTTIYTKCFFCVCVSM